MKLLLLILSLPTENATVRQRAWRALKACGAAVLRDGVYLMPERESCRLTLDSIAADVISGGGSAHVLLAESDDDQRYISLFDRSGDYGILLDEVTRLRQGLSAGTALDGIKQMRKLRKSFAALAAIDFFPGAAQQQVASVLSEVELACARHLSPDEPQAIDGAIPLLDKSVYQGRLWATRQRPWVDRLASAWLIRRFIDTNASLCWLASPSDCPPDALGFDFDGATFSHVGGRVTFEVLAASFALEQTGIARLGALVHYLDIGGVQPPEAAGVEAALAGLRAAELDDNRLLERAAALFDGLYQHYNGDTP